MTLRTRSALALAFALIALARPGAAAPCGRPDLRAAFPDDGARGVPLDARLSAIYAESAEYLGEPVELGGPDGPIALTPSFDGAERRLSVRPEAGLSPETEYGLIWPELRGLGSASRGLGRTLRFTTGASVDAAPPSFGGVTGLDWDVRHDRDDCTDDLEERFRFELRLDPAGDDTASSELELVVLQTRGPAARDSPRLVARSRFPESRRARLDLAVEDTTGRVCFAALVQDLAGNVSASGSVERCARTTEPPFFYGCAFERAPSGPSSSAAGLALAAAGLGARRRRPRRAPR